MYLHIGTEDGEITLSLGLVLRAPIGGATQPSESRSW